MAVDGLTYICDHGRHLVCLPFSVENLHRMAVDLGIDRCWFHRGTPPRPHYDIPKRRVAEVTSRCVIVSQRTTLRIIKGEIVSPLDLPRL